MARRVPKKRPPLLGVPVMANITPKLQSVLLRRADILWEPGPDAVKYEIWDGSQYIDTVPASTRRYVTAPLAVGSHNFRVVGYGTDGSHSNSNIISVNVIGEAPPPAPEPVPTPTFKFNNLVFEDNFEILDLNKWSLYNGPGHAGNGLRDPNAWSIQSGVAGATGKCLVCTASWDATIGKIRSGGMSMKNQSHLYGRFAARVRFEPDPLHVTNALFMTWPSDGQWPIHGENNIWESNSGDRTPMMTFIHYDSDNKQKYFAHPGSDGTVWNEVQMEWTADYIKIWVNGVLSWTMTDQAAIPDWAHHVTLQQDAMRNADPGRSIHAYYDWVKVYK